MLKKLKRKIVYINVSLVSVVMIAALAVFCVNNYTSARSELLASLQSVGVPLDALPDEPRQPPEEEGDAPEPVLGEKRGLFKPDGAGPKFSVAYVAVVLDAQGDVEIVSENGASIDEDTLDACAALLQEAENDASDILHTLGVAYHVRVLPDGTRIATLADTAMVTSALQRSLLTSLLLYAGSMVVIVLLSMGLARLAVKPTEQAWTQQRQFLADASHELKTPLTVILANNDILLAHPEDTLGEQRRWLESTGEEAAHMKGLIDRMLTLARSDEEKLAPVIAEFDLGELAQGCVLTFEPVAFEKAVALTGDTQSVTVRSDRAMVAQIIQILLDNAVKYTEKGGEIVLSVSAQGGGTLSVKNTGEPIPPEVLAHLFDRFYRADKARDRSGYGLGLAIAKSIADTLKIKLSVQSDAVSGTVFTLRF